MLSKGAKNRFHRGLPFGFQVPSVGTFHPGIVPLILGPEMGYCDAFLLRLCPIRMTHQLDNFSYI